MKQNLLFFQPWVGPLYLRGLRGVPTLVCGTSFYCSQNHCKYFRKCTSSERYDSSREFDKECPVYKTSGKCLSQEPSYCVEEQPISYQRFAKYIATLLEMDQEEVFDHVAFTNFSQHFLDATDSYRVTRASDLFHEDLLAFIETLQERKPKLVILWGTAATDIIRDSEYLVSREELERTEWYCFTLRVPGVGHDIKVVNPYHPSSSAWFAHLEQFGKYLLKSLNC